MTRQELLRLLLYKIKPIIMAIFLILLLDQMIYAQSVSLLQVTPKSPNVAGLDKFIETPVSLGTGKIDVNIPLYEINIGNLKIPITLNYNNNGLKPDEIPSWVGLGWSLFTGGYISYNQKGINDFDPVKGLFTQGQSLLNSYFASQMTPTQKGIYFNDIVVGNVDSEYDEFYYSIPDEQGSFHFISSTESRTNPKSDIVISKTSMGFKIVDKSGNIYFFESQESITTENTLNISPDFSDNSAYYLSKIVTANGEFAEFKYKQYYLQYITQNKYLTHSGSPLNSENCPSSSGINVDEILNHVYYLLPDRINFTDGYIKFNHSVDARADLKSLLNSFGDVPYLSSMQIYDLSDVKIKSFNFGISYFGSNSKLRLDGINEVNGSLTSRSWKFDYYGQDNYLPGPGSGNIDHWGYANDGGSGSTIAIPNANYAAFIPNWVNYSASYFADKSASHVNSSMGLLKKITHPTKGITEFEYEANQFKINNPEEFDFGLFMKPPAIIYDQPIFYADSYTNTNVGDVNFTIPKSGYYRVSAFRQLSPDPFYMDASILIRKNGVFIPELNSIINQCSGDQCVCYQKLVYFEAGTFTCTLQGSSYWDNTLFADRYLRAWLEINGTKFPMVVEVGGNRIKKVINTDPVKNSSIIKKYLYNDSLSRVNFRQVPYYITSIEKEFYYSGSENPIHGCIPCGSTDYYIHEKSARPLTGNVIEYEKVSILTDESGITGRTDQEFLFSDNFGGSSSEPFLAAINSSWKTGKIKSEKQYSGNSVLKSDVKNLYIGDYSGTHINGLRVSAGSICNTYGIIGTFRTNLSTLISEKFTLESSESKLYDSPTPVAVNTSYTYNLINHSNPVLVSNNASDGDLVTKKTTYVFDYNNLASAVTPAANGLKWLKTSHINAPVEELDIKEIGGVKYITGGLLKIYKSAQSVPEQIYTLDLTSPVLESDFVYSSINGTGDFIKDSRYVLKITYNLYDNLNNILEQSLPQGLLTAYVWGYKGKYPVAEIKNASYSLVETALGGSTAIESFRNTINPSPSVLTSFLAPLRTSPLLKDALVTTYTYQPLVGMISSMDSKGLIASYEYDDFQRLKSVKDQDGNVIKSYDYHYKNNN